MSTASPREHCENALQCRPVACPPFLPAIYEHKGWFLRETPSRVARDPDLFFRALLAEYAEIQPDALTVGIDVYNIEAEAVGCQVTFYEGDDVNIPGIAPQHHVVKSGDRLEDVRIPDPLQAGRMPLLVEVARRTTAELGSEVWVRGAVSGPFSLAVSLMGSTELFMCTIEDPDFVRRLLQYAGCIIKQFGQAFIDVGAGVVLFDSQASPDLLSPQMYESFVQPVMCDVVAYFNDQGVRDVPLIIGGNTTSIADRCIETGANNLLCDFTGDWPTWLAKCHYTGRAIRRNLDPRFIQTGDPDAIYAATQRMIAESQGYPGFIVGTAVVPYGTPSENLLAVRQACRDKQKN